MKAVSLLRASVPLTAPREAEQAKRLREGLLTARPYHASLRHSEVSGVMSAPVLDRDHLEQYTAGDAALEAELFGLLSNQIEACVSALKAATSETEWRNAAHTLKGASRGVGAMELGEACALAEGRFKDAEALQAVVTAADRANNAMAAVRR